MRTNLIATNEGFKSTGSLPIHPFGDKLNSFKMQQSTICLFLFWAVGTSPSMFILGLVPVQKQLSPNGQFVWTVVVFLHQLRGHFQSGPFLGTICTADLRWDEFSSVFRVDYIVLLFRYFSTQALHFLKSTYLRIIRNLGCKVCTELSSRHPE